MGHIIDNAALRGVTLFSFHSLQSKYTQRWVFGTPHLSPPSAARQNWFCKCGKKWICRRRRARFSSFWFPRSPTDSFVTYFDEKKTELRNCSGLLLSSVADSAAAQNIKTEEAVVHGPRCWICRRSRTRGFCVPSHTTTADIPSFW